MAASITANPNPVVFPEHRIMGPLFGGGMDTKITWDADGPRARVFQFLNGQETLFDGDPQRGNRNGSKDATIELGQTLEFRLREADTGKLLASVKVTTEEAPLLPLAIPDRLKNWPARVQGIFQLTVVPGVDSVTITYRTRRPAYRYVEIHNQNTGKIEGLVYGPYLQEVHSVEFGGPGVAFPLEHDTTYTYRILAQRTPGTFDPSTNVVEFGRFQTGSRTATVFFDKIHVRNDGDPGLKGAGEFTFTFGAGDVITQQGLGSVERWGRGDIDAGSDVDVNRAVTIPAAPRRLWATVFAFEDDKYFYPGAGIQVVGMAPTFGPPVTSGSESEHFATARVTVHFAPIDGTFVGTSETPFQMSTGDFSIAYDVSGRLRVEARAGAWLRPIGPPRPQLLGPTVSAFSVVPGRSAMVVGARGHAHRVILDPEGAVYHEALGGDPQGPPDGRWTSLGGRFRGSLTVVATADGVSLFGLSPDGAVLHKTHAPDARPDDDWQVFGGAFVGRIAAVAGADGAIELFATNEDGAVFHRTLADPRRQQPRGEWECVGDGIGGSMAALFSPRTGLSLFALGREGEVLHKRRPSTEAWRPAGREWETLGVAWEGSLSAEWVGEEGLLLAVVAEDETVRLLAWPAYPDGPAPESWEMVGTVNSLLQGRIPEDEAKVSDRPEGVGDLRDRS